MSRLLSAFGFLTILPIPASWQGSENNLGCSVFYFPVVGLLIGLTLAALSFCLQGLLPPLVLSVLLTVCLLGISGGLHMDGLSDTADGFLSCHPRERVLEIMRDSHVGVFGATAIFCVLAFKIAALSSVIDGGLCRAVFLAPLAGRCGIVWMMNTMPRARHDSLATIFSREHPVRESLFAAAMLFAAAVWTTGWTGGAAATLGVMAALGVFALACQRRIGGITGDTVGAACEIAETAALLILSVRPFGG